MNDSYTIYADTQYRMAFKEVLVILNNIPKSDYEKIPDDIIQTLKDNQEDSYNFNLEIGKTINEQKISELTKAIIENFYRDYWVTEAERQKILQEEKYENIKIEEEKRKKYNPDNIFNIANNEKNNNLESKAEEKNLIKPRKEKWYNKIIKLLKNKLKI